jgi:hypothetical protein
MESNDRDRIRRILEAALASLKDEPSGNALSRLAGVTSINLPSTGVEPSSAPVVIIIHPKRSESAGVSTTSAAQPAESHSCGCHHDESQPHPGVERFPLSEAGSRDPSRMCFIEPDRVCVGSGACEALGY